MEEEYSTGLALTEEPEAEQEPGAEGKVPAPQEPALQKEISDETLPTQMPEEGLPLPQTSEDEPLLSQAPEEELPLQQSPDELLKNITEKTEVLQLLDDMMRSEDTSAQHRLKAIELLVKYTGLFERDKEPANRPVKVKAEKEVRPWMG